MKTTLFLPFLTGLALLSLGCGGGGECEKAFDKELECGDDSDERKERMKSQRSEAISSCKKNKDNPRMKAAIKCGKTNSCEEFKACTLAARSEDDIKEIEEALAAGEPDKAMRTCTYQLDTYTAVPDFKAACDKAITATFSKLDSEDQRGDGRYTCASSSDAKKWRDASSALAEGCKSLATKYKTIITKQRDEGSEYNYSDCSGYRDLMKAIDNDKLAEASLLCDEAEVADDFAEGFSEIAKNITEKKKTLPFRCSSILDPKYNSKTVEKLKDSKWFAGKSLELAKACYGGEMGTLLLGEVSSYCGSTQKKIHAAAAKYNLAADNAELQALLDSTAEKCTK